MNVYIDSFRDMLGEGPWWLPWAVVTAAVVAAIAVFAMLISAVRSQSYDVKLRLGFAVVQAGVAFGTLPGVYAFFLNLFELPEFESVLLSVVAEAAVWTTVGFVFSHLRSLARRKGDGEEISDVDWGPAAQYFWLCQACVGAMAVLGSETDSMRLGRVTLAVLGISLWRLRFTVYIGAHFGAVKVAPTRWRWTPRRLMYALGALEPKSSEMVDQNREWTVGRMAGAVARRNSKIRVVAWWGARSVARLSRGTSPDVIAEAQARVAAALALIESCTYTSPQMREAIAAAKATGSELGELGRQRVLAAARADTAAATAPPTPRVVEGTVVEKDTAASAAHPPVPAQEPPAGRHAAPQRKVTQLADQLDRDQRAARTILALVAEKTNTATVTSWAQVTNLIESGRLLTWLDKESKAREGQRLADSDDTYVYVSKPRIYRLLPHGPRLHPLPADAPAA